MRRLFLIRHAKTEPQSGMPDAERRLLPRGHADAARLAEWFRKNRQSADALVHSTAVRAIETADALAQGWLPQAPRIVKAELYAAPWRVILGSVRDFPDTTQSAAIVAHNPGMFELANILTGSGEPAARTRLMEGLPTCGCAVLDFSLASWTKLETGSGRLSLFLTPDNF